MLESNAYKTYYAFAFGKKAPKPKYVQKKADPDTSPKQKPVQATKGTRIKSKAKVSKFDKKKQPTKKPKAKGLAVLSEVALTEVGYQKKQERLSHIYNASAKGEWSYTIKKESWGDSDEKDDNEDDFATNDDKQEGDDTNDDDEETNSDITESDRIEIPILDQSTTEFYKEEEEENIDVEEMMYDDEDDEVTKELYEDVNVNLRNEDTDMTNVDQGALEQQNKTRGPTQSSSVSSYFTNKLLNLDNPSPVDNKIASLMVTTAQHATAIPEIASKTTTSLPALPDFAYVFKFNERVFNLEKDVSEIKQDDQYAQALSSIPAIVDCYMDNKLGEAINKVILAHNLDYRQEA
ncbi:hypothetical protein Tco_0676877 [Tanacetum coccineum]